jgi:hypothetical protein
MRRTHLFYRRHYETIGRALGNAYFHVRSRVGEQTLDLVVAMLVRVFRSDAPDSFQEHRWKAYIVECTRDSEDDDEQTAAATRKERRQD